MRDTQDIYPNESCVAHMRAINLHMTQTLSTKVAVMIRAELARQGIPKSELARRIGISQPGVSRRLNGQTPFQLDELAVASELLGIPLAELIKDHAA